ncbi:hypothetical protein TcYC6_0075650 [Trypanosoma cruzi]|nr:hypothetical protein TcYC6_0075650 [Trypanosoma cruzi]
MFRKIYTPLTRGLTTTVCAASLSLFSCTRWETSGRHTPPNAGDEDEEDFSMIFNDDFHFLDECFGETGLDVFDYIPEHEAALLGHDKR